MDKRKLAIDIDDTLADTAYTIMAQMSQKFGVPEEIENIQELMRVYFQPGEVTYWHQPSASEWLFKTYNDPLFIGKLPVIPEAVYGVNQLLTSYQIDCYITSRPPHLYDASKAWISLHGFPEAPVVVRPLLESRPNWKLRFLSTRQTPVWGLIDDDPQAFLKPPLKSPQHLYWFNRFWRKTSLINNLSVATSWPELVTALLSTT